MSRKVLAKEIILSNNYWALNKTVVKALGVEASLILTILTEAESLMSDEDGWFFQTIETIEELTTIKRHRQDTSIKLLTDLGILEQNNKGIPMKRFFRIDYGILANYIVGDKQPSLSEINKLDCRKSTRSKESTYKQHTYKEHSYKDKDITKPAQGSDVHKRSDTNKYDFSSFWSLYPRKSGSKKLTESLFHDIVTNQEIYDAIMSDLDNRKICKNWVDDNGKWIPGAIKYLENEMWNESYEVIKVTEPYENIGVIL